MKNEDELIGMDGLFPEEKWIPRWRPSIEQVDALKWVIEHLGDSYAQVTFYLEQMLEEMKCL